MVELTTSPIDVQRLLGFVSHPDAGGQVLFVGSTRQTTGGQVATDSSCGQHSTVQCTHTQYLVYEAYQEMAEQKLHELAQQAQRQWPLHAVAISHRLGKVLPGEASIAIVVSSAHRHEAYVASRWLIDSIKQQVPIWKQEHYVDSAAQWIHPKELDASESSDAVFCGNRCEGSQ
ncbi:MAG TPA: molybdopterin converting factor [Planctomycetaceae bacterium]|nr:molybdopterin converting factor [Planctomycetaceae bacterium]